MWTLRSEEPADHAIITQVNGAHAVEDEPEKEEDSEDMAGQKASAAKADMHLRSLESCREQKEGLQSEVVYLHMLGMKLMQSVFTKRKITKKDRLWGSYPEHFRVIVFKHTRVLMYNKLTESDTSMFLVLLVTRDSFSRSLECLL